MCKTLTLIEDNSVTINVNRCLQLFRINRQNVKIFKSVKVSVNHGD